jgi:transposase
VKQLRKVKREYERLKIENELLKKAIEFTSKRKQASSPSSSTAKRSTRSG